jgi:enoyl-CoA hydratase/carnithine racemase
MSEQLVESEIENGVETWTMHHAPVNALSPELADVLEERLDATLANEAVSVVVLASGLRVFSAGADAKWIAEVVSTHGSAQLVDEFKVTLDRFRDLFRRMRESDVLFVACIGGHAIAGGLELAAACDLRFAADDERIKIGASEMKLFGVMPSGGGGTQYLSRLMGPSRALEFLLEAEPCAPARALELGLVERLVAPDALVPEAKAFAGRIAGRAGRVGVNAAKRLTLDAATLPLSEALELDAEVHWDSMRRGGFVPGVDAFVAQFGS